MEPIINNDKYIIEHSMPEDPKLAELSRETHLKALHPRMLSGRIQGQLLTFISNLLKPKNILELGTFTGYSALCLAKGLSKGGMLHTLERNDELEYFHKKYLLNSEYADNITLHIGDATKIIPELNIMFDLVFIDADKKSYPDFYNMIIEKTNIGGVIIADNVLWNGKVFHETVNGDVDTSAIKEFNRMIYEDERVENFILPIRDGLSLMRRIK